MKSNACSAEDPVDVVLPEFLIRHARTKKARGRGTPSPNQKAVEVYLTNLEAEMEAVRQHLDQAWVMVESTKNFRKCAAHMDHAQQRLHRAIKKISKHPK